MLRRSVNAFRYAAIIFVAGIVFYILKPEYGMYLLGIGLVAIALAAVLYVVFMFRRYGDKTPIE